MSDLNEFIREIIQHNDLLNEDELAQGDLLLSQHPELNLAQVLVSQKMLTVDVARQVMDACKDQAEEAPSAASPPASGIEHAPEDMVGYLTAAREMGASDLHINTGAVPFVRIHGRIQPIGDRRLEAKEVEKMIQQVLTEDQIDQLRKDLAYETCLHLPDLGRYRTVVVHQRIGFDCAFRVVDNAVPAIEDLGLPKSLVKLTEFHQGLVLITGPNGCGKTSTMAALVDIVNKSREEHIITIEDPIELEYESKLCHINQRQAGKHTKSFAAALRAALREDPDVIVIGELRDRDSIALAISAAETGHLVLGTLHTTSAARTIDRLLDVFPPDEQEQIRSMVSESIKGIVCQQLLPRQNGQGRVMALEILFNNTAVSSLIRERKLFQITSVMQTGAKQGMKLFEDSLEDLVVQGEISGEDAYFAANEKERFAAYAPIID